MTGTACMEVIYFSCYLAEEPAPCIDQDCAMHYNTVKITITEQSKQTCLKGNPVVMHVREHKQDVQLASLCACINPFWQLKISHLHVGSVRSHLLKFNLVSSPLLLPQ